MSWELLEWPSEGRVRGSNPLECATFQFQGLRKVYQMTVSKRLTFWHRSLLCHDMGEVADKLLIKSRLVDLVDHKQIKTKRSSAFFT